MGGIHKTANSKYLYTDLHPLDSHQDFLPFSSIASLNFSRLLKCCVKIRHVGIPFLIIDFVLFLIIDSPLTNFIYIKLTFSIIHRKTFPF